MALKIERSGTTTSNVDQKPRLCHTCKDRKPGLFTVDPYGNPMCAACAREHGRPID